MVAILPHCSQAAGITFQTENHRRYQPDFCRDMPLDDLPATSRLRDLSLGAGSLLDIGIYSLTWALLTLESSPGGSQVQRPKVNASQTLVQGVDVSTSALLYYADTGRHGLISSSLLYKTDDVFARVEGSKGTLFLKGDTASMPDTIIVSLKPENAQKDMGDKKPAASNAQDKRALLFKFDELHWGKGFYHEADAIALDIAAGHKESQIMPLGETLRVMRILDEIRAQGGAKFPQDD